MNKFIDWMIEYDAELTWFWIGMLLQLGLFNLAAGNWGWAMLDFSLVFLNIATYKRG